jgi:hypothetical protein
MIELKWELIDAYNRVRMQGIQSGYVNFLKYIQSNDRNITILSEEDGKTV